MILNEYSDLGAIRLNHIEGIVYTSGTFDITHAGHVLFFEDAKKQGDVLVVGTPEDRVVRAIKGDGRPIQNQYVRSKMIDSLKPVDYCFVNKNHRLEELEIIFEELRPNVYVVNEDAFDIDERREYAERFNVDLVVLERRCPPEFENISTSQIIEKIKNS
jgi:glycerol-3-phosphate cytidylyltransferase|tara:strand:- start:124 stop:603 length:480 start_codon:yes stop_codon:yes gene_type:complete